MPDDRLNWFVPFRRVVVRQRIPYAELVASWRVELVTNTMLVGVWYDPNGPASHPGLGDAGAPRRASTFGDAEYQRGISALRHWERRTFEQEATRTSTDPEGETALETGLDFHGRVWKGPLRVLREASDALAPLPLLEGVVHGTPDEVRGIELLMGDVVEVPIFRFLAACGLADYAPLEFNPGGSFYLGTSVRRHGETVSPPAEPVLHDNMLAMRFQLVVSLGMGAFAHDQPVFSAAGRGPRAPDGSVFARGMIYAGALHVDNDSRDHWTLHDMQWAGAGEPRNIPTLGALRSLGAEQTVTPGWSCSPFTLFLLQFMADQDGSAGRGFLFASNVHSTMKRSPDVTRVADGVFSGDGEHPRPTVAEQVQARLTGEQRAAFDRGDEVPLEFSQLFPEVAREGPSIAVVSLSSHEFGLATLFPAADLMRQEARPLMGFVAAFNPLTGVDVRDGDPPAGERRGRLFYCEATGRKLVTLADVGFTGFTAQPWRFEATTEQPLVLKKTRTSVEVRVTDRSGIAVYALNDDATFRDRYARPKSWLPILIGSSRTTGRSQTLTDTRTRYAERAVPFPTLAEIDGDFLRPAEIEAQLARIRTQLGPRARDAHARIDPHRRALADARGSARAASARLLAAQRARPRNQAAIDAARAEARAASAALTQAEDEVDATNRGDRLLVDLFDAISEPSDIGTP